MLTIVDYGMGNIGSITNMLKSIGVESRVCSSKEGLQDATKLILPGVGAFDAAMSKINQLGLREVLDRKALAENIPILGICLGMQLMTDSSEEGLLPGLGWIKAKTIRFPKHESLKIPHMGWNQVYANSPSILCQDFSSEERFYFVHSFYVEVEDDAHSIMKTEYVKRFDSGISKGNIFGVQFHPEKSHKFGKRILKNFVELA